MKNIQKRWFVYILECADKTLYTGVTTDIDRRVYEHNNTSKGAKYTASRRPVKLVACKLVHDKSLAFRLEHRVKKQKKYNKINFLTEWKNESN